MNKNTCLMMAAAAVAGNLWAADPALTIYNQQFAVVRDKLHLDLKRGLNAVNYSEATRQLEPDSVVLRDPSGRQPLQILEQNYRADAVSQGLLLSLFEGKTIRFETEEMLGGQIQKKLIQGKIIRSGYTRPMESLNRLMLENPLVNSEPLIEVNGELTFQLPGVPRFPSLPDTTILKPTLSWQINSTAEASFDAELGYVTGGFTWKADYNLVAPEKGDTLDLVGWVSINNQSGKSFEHARIKLMAGDVNKVQPPVRVAAGGRGGGGARGSAMVAAPPPVTEEAFDEYHLYTLEHPTTLLDREIKQVEFVQVSQIPCKPVYVYDGARLDFMRYSPALLRTAPDYGVTGNTKVSVMREFYNSTSNHLGMPLPKGRMRFYRLDTDGQMQFTGENDIDHTAKDEVIRVTVGNAFDVVGERRRTNIHVDTLRTISDESFEIKLRNHKTDPVTVRVVEHLRGLNWEVKPESDKYEKKDAQTIEFRVDVAPNGEKTLAYSVHYTW
jgi:hypothetical protein